MATIRATVNKFGFYALDVKFDIASTDDCLEMVKTVIKQVVPDYNPLEAFWSDAVKEALNENYHYHYWGDLIISLYYDKRGRN